MQEVDIYANDNETFSTDSFNESFDDVPDVPDVPVVPEAPIAQQALQDGGSKNHKTGQPIVVIKKDEVAQPIKEYEESVSSESGSDSDSDSGSDSTVDCLSRDPLFLVLSQYLANSKGNIVDVLCKINKNLKRIADSLEKR
jgi:hypothetical protein